MKLSRFWQWLGMLLLMVGLAGCRPDAEFVVSPDPVVAGQAATFDASASKAYREDKGNKIVKYEWNFGDGSKATGKVVQHVFAAAGSYPVSLTVVDARNERDTVRQTVVVKAAGAQGAVSLLIRSADGATVNNAKVTVAGVVAQSDANGVAQLSGVATGAEQVVLIEKAGFVPQALRVPVTAGQTAKAFAVLKPLGDTLRVTDISLAQRFLSSTLGASVDVPANAFVKADGSAATGAVTVQLTPWDVQGSDLGAMPGDGQARDASGARTQLISAGMITVDVYAADGSKLQLASGKTAKIRMDLPMTSLNGQTLDVGSSIPMWHFSEAEGLWVEEGVGSVVLADTATTPTGLAVEAVVSHFSTWNWDIKFNGGGTTDVRCQLADGTPVECALSAKVVLPDGSVLNKTAYADVAGVTIINMPSTADITWTATTSYGAEGTATSAVGGSVVIVVAAPKSSHFVQCQLADATAVACSAQLSGTTSDGSYFERRVQVSAEGAWVHTQYEAASFDWVGANAPSLVGGVFAYFQGSTSVSSATGNVVIPLTEQRSGPQPSRTVRIGCEASTFMGTAVPSCTISELALSSIVPSIVFDGPMASIYVDLLGGTPVTLAAGQRLTVVIPAGLPADLDPVIQGYALASDAFWTGYLYTSLSSVVDGVDLMFAWYDGITED